MINMPLPFQGTDAEKETNRLTHSFAYDMDGDARCWNCDCKPWHRTADYPCGVEPPRITVSFDKRGN